jgi:cytochrome c556
MTSFRGPHRRSTSSSQRALRRGTCCSAAVLLLAACVSAAGTHKSPILASSEVGHASSSARAPNAPDLPTRAQLPDEAREMLTDRMLRHGDDMGDLTVAVLMLEYDLTQALAGAMADEPKLGRPAPGETGTLNALLPNQFFVQQDALAASAKALSEAASKRDDARIAAAFGEVAKACVSCHSAYLNAELDPPTNAADARTKPCNPEEECGENEAR